MVNGLLQQFKHRYLQTLRAESGKILARRVESLTLSRRVVVFDFRFMKGEKIVYWKKKVSLLSNYWVYTPQVKPLGKNGNVAKWVQTI
jgi:hypothetical protein